MLGSVIELTDGVSMKLVLLDVFRAVAAVLVDAARAPLAVFHEGLLTGRTPPRRIPGGRRMLFYRLGDGPRPTPRERVESPQNQLLDHFSFLLVRNFFYQIGGKRERQGESESLSRSPSQEVRTYDAAQSKPQDAYTRLLLLGEQEAFRFHFPPFGVERTFLCRTGFGISGSFHDLFSKGLEGARSAEAGR